MRRFVLLTAALFALLGLGLGGALAAPAAPPPLHLHYLKLAPAERRGALDALGAPARQLIVQFAHPIRPADRAALVATGVELLEYLPDYAFLVDGAPAQLAAAAALPGLARSIPAPAALRFAPALLRGASAGASLGPLQLVAWPGHEAALAAALVAAGIDPARPLSRAELRRLARIASLRWAEPAPQPRLLNDSGRTIMRVDSAAWERRGFYGAGQILAITDSGLDTGSLASLSPDFAGRVVASHALAPNGDLEDENGHGTHVAGSAAGAGVQSGANPAANEYGGAFAGIAPQASLVIQAFEADAAGQVTGIPADYYAIFAQAYASGARLHSDSWGDETGPPSQPEQQYGGYPYGSQRLDAFVWEHPDLAIFVAAGNSGRDGTPGALGFCSGGDGVIDPDSLLAPATAKNAISVGASEGQRASGGAATIPWLLLSFCFATQPIASDLTSNNPDGLAAFSSRGPTDDGRMKPDIVAPGTNIISNRSHAPGAGQLWGAHESNSHYVYSGGTSMATPLVAGAGVLVREWLMQSGLSSPSAALVKGVLLNTARPIAPGQYGSGPQQEIPASWPNSVAGWGRADLGFFGAAAPFAIWYDEHSAGLSTGQLVEYSHSVTQPLEVRDSGQPLRVHLVWSDPAAALGAAKQLVNDLDLELIGPDGTLYRGNAGTSADRINNVEGIMLAAPAVGRYSVRVRAFNVPTASQPYALVVSGSVGAEPQAQTITFPPPTGLTYGDAPITLGATASSGLPVSYTVLQGPASVSGSQLTLAGAGEVRVRASQSGGAGYAPASSEVSFSVARAALAARAVDQLRRVGQANPPLTISYSGFVSGDDPTDLDTPPVATTIATPASPPGNYPITLSGGADANYSLSYSPGTLRVSAKQIPTLSWAEPTAVVYGARLGPGQLSAAVSFGGAPLAGSFSYEPPAGTALPAGSHTLRVTFSPTDSAGFEPVSASVTLRIERAPLAITAEDQQMVAGQPLPALTARYAGFVPGDGPGDLSSPVQLRTSATPSSPPGIYPISAAGAGAANYTIVYIPGQLRVLPAAGPDAGRLYLPLLAR